MRPPRSLALFAIPSLVAWIVLAGAFSDNEESRADVSHVQAADHGEHRLMAPGLAADSAGPPPTPTSTPTAGPPTLTPTATTVPPTATATQASQASQGPWYTSAFHSAQCYYCAADTWGWQGLSASNLRGYPTEAALLAEWSGQRVKHPDSAC